MWHFVAGAVTLGSMAANWARNRWARVRAQSVNAAPLASSNVQRAVDNPSALSTSSFHGDATMMDERPNPPVVIGTTPLGQDVVAIAPNVPGTTDLSAAMKAATSSACFAAHNLFDFLSSNPTHTTNDQTFHAYVSDFQKAVNAEPECMAILAHPLRDDGMFDLATSAMLTVMTGDPIPPIAGMSPEDKIKSSGPAALSGSNLYAFLRRWGNVNQQGPAFRLRAPKLMILVRQFQQAVNTDPHYPGPVTAKGKALSDALPVNGQYDKATAAALSHITMDHVNP